MTIHEFVAKQLGKEKADTAQVLAFFSNSARTFKTIEECAQHFMENRKLHLKCDYMSNLDGCEAIVSVKDIYTPNGFVIMSLSYLYAKTVRTKSIPSEDCISFLIEQKQGMYDFYENMTRRRHAEAMLNWGKKGDAMEATRFISMISEHLLENNVGIVTYNQKHVIVQDDLTVCWWLAQQYFSYYAKCINEGKSPDYISAYSAFLRTNQRMFMDGLEWQDLPALINEMDLAAIKAANEMIDAFTETGQQSDEENIGTLERVQIRTPLQNASDLPF